MRLPGIVIALFFATGSGWSQGELGGPLITNYGDLPGHDENWAAMQDERGVLYFANTAGFLRYDGARWTLVQTGRKSGARSLAKDANGRIYAGCKGEFGYLDSDSTGRTVFRSLSDRLDSADRQFSDVWRTHVTAEGIYFQSNVRLFRYDGQSIKVWKPTTVFRFAFVVNGKLFVQIKDEGLAVMDGDSLRLLIREEPFKTDRVTLMLPLHENTILIGLAQNGLMVWNDRTVSRWKTEADEFFKSRQVYSGCHLPDGTLMIGTVLGGAVCLDRAGKILFHLSTSSGLQDNQIWNVYVDRQRDLWFSMNKGVARIEWPSAMTLFRESQKLDGTVRCLARHDGRLYVGTSFGLSVLKPSRGLVPAQFERIPGVEPQVWDLESIDRDLLVASNAGLYVVTAVSARKIHPANCFTVLRSHVDSSKIYVGLTDGLMILRQRHGSYEEVHRLVEFSDDARSMAETIDGSVWIGTLNKGVRRVRMGPNGATGMEVFDHRHGLPHGWTNVQLISGRITVTTAEGVFTPDSSDQRFVPALRDYLAPGREVYPLVEDDRHDLWMGTGEHGFGALRSTGRGSYELFFKPFKRLGPFDVQGVVSQDDGVVWFGGADGMARFDQRLYADTLDILNVILHRITVNSDSVIYEHRIPGVIGVFDASVINWRFEAAWPHFGDEARTLYQFRLEGLEENWSGWTNENRKDYTNLPAGDYTFRVRAMDLHGNRSGDTVVEFRILPRWYRTWLAYAGYGLLLGLTAWAGLRWRTKRLRQKNEELEATIERRTQDLKTAQVQLLHSEKMASIGHMVAGIAHEINNPLTFVGPNVDFIDDQVRRLMDLCHRLLDADPAMRGTVLEELRREVNSPSIQTDLPGALKSSKEGSRRIQTIVEHLRSFVDLPEEGHAPTDVNKNLEILLDLFKHRHTDVRIHMDFKPVPVVMANTGSLHQCFMDVLHNAVQAVKDARDQGRQNSGNITISTGHEGTWVSVAITDDGIGIPAEIINKIFDPFFTTRQVGKGAGLGLSEVYGIIRQHNGEIKVDSSIGQGTTVTIRLPAGEVKP